MCAGFNNINGCTAENYHGEDVLRRLQVANVFIA
jgi:hypothetical protein